MKITATAYQNVLKRVFSVRIGLAIAGCFAFSSNPFSAFFSPVVASLLTGSISSIFLYDYWKQKYDLYIRGRSVRPKYPYKEQYIVG